MSNVQNHVGFLYLVLNPPQLLPTCIQANIDSICSYNEALPVMLSVPLYTIQYSPRILVTDISNLGTLNHIRNLNLCIYFFKFPQYRPSADLPYNMDGWIRICRTLSSMTSLRFLCVYILQERFNWYFKVQSQERSAKLVRQLLEPLESIKVAEKGGRFDVITQGWRVPYVLNENLPFNVIQERLPPLTDLAHRTLELGEVSQSSYLKLVSMPWPVRYRP